MRRGGGREERKETKMLPKFDNNKFLSCSTVIATHSSISSVCSLTNSKTQSKKKIGNREKKV